MKKQQLKIKNCRTKTKNGFAIMLALVVTSVLLTVGLGVFDIMFRELIFSGMGRDSQKAFYAADSGIECALFWDLKYPGFSEPVFATSTESTPPLSGVPCNNEDIALIWTLQATPVLATTNFELNFTNGTCVSVSVFKELDTVSVSASGYNLACDSTDSRKVERGLRATY